MFEYKVVGYYYDSRECLRFGEWLGKRMNKMAEEGCEVYPILCSNSTICGEIVYERKR